MKDGDYSSRVELNLKNEFGELEYIFNEMAEQSEQEIWFEHSGHDPWRNEPDKFVDLMINSVLKKTKIK